MLHKMFSVEIIDRLISRGKEGEYWDFKQEWHEKMQDLVKDIICFANTVHDKDCYLIFGISDTLEIKGMEQPRRKQADILDAFSHLKFEDNEVPKIEVDTILYGNVELDVLTIFNTDRTPIYLKQNYGNMKAGCIYTRVGDRNTPDGENAKTNEIECLWKKRLGLTKIPLDYIIGQLQNKEEWGKNGDYYYNIYRPEYTLHQYDNEDSEQLKEEFYCYSQTNESSFYSNLDIVCNGTSIDYYQIVSLDGGRLSIPVPEWGFLKLDQSHQIDGAYKYFIADSNRFKLLQFMYDEDDLEQRWAFQNLLKVVLIFESELEKNAFEGYIEFFPEKITDKIEKIDDYSYIKTETERKTKRYIERLHRGIALNELLKEWRQIEI